MSGLAIPDVRWATLPGGLPVAVAQRPGVPLVAARFAVRAGSALDPDGAQGLAHLVAIASRRGAGRLSGRGIDDRVESLGADLAGAAEEDATVHGLSAPVEVVGRLAEVLAAVVTRPSFPLAEFERLRRRELAELAHDADEISTVADRALLQVVYGDHPYGHAVEGRGADLSRVRRPHAVAFHRRHFTPSQSLLVLVGPGDPDRTLDEARRILGSWKGEGAADGGEIPPARRSARRVILLDRADATQSQVRIGGVAIPRSSPDYLPAQVGNAVLGGGFTSRLVEAIRVNRGLTYGIRSRFGVGRVAGLFGVSTFTRNDAVGELLSVAFDEMSRFAADGPTEEETGRAAAWLAGLFPLGLETHDQWADRIVDSWIYGYDLAEIRERQAQLRAVTREQARDCTARHLPLGDGVIVAVGPASVLEPQLSRFGPVEVWPVRRAM